MLDYLLSFNQINCGRKLIKWSTSTSIKAQQSWCPVFCLLTRFTCWILNVSHIYTERQSHPLLQQLYLQPTEESVQSGIDALQTLQMYISISAIFTPWKKQKPTKSPRLIYFQRHAGFSSSTRYSTRFVGQAHDSANFTLFPRRNDADHQDSSCNGKHQHQ